VEVLIIVMVKVKLSSYKNKLYFTIPAKLLRKINVKIGDYIKINLKKDSHDFTYYSKIPKIPESRTNLQLRRAVPKSFVDKLKIRKDDELELSIFLIKNIKSTNLITDNNYLDILAAIPEETENGNLIMVDLFRRDNKEWCKIWCCNGHGGNVKIVELRRFIKIDKKLGEFFGLMQAESSKKGGHFDFTNKFLSEIELFIEVVELFGISKKEWKYVLFYKPFMKNEDLNKFINNFSKKFCITKEKIITIKNKNLLDVIYSIYISSTLLREIMISLLIKIRSYIANSKELDFYLKEFSKGFILKDLLGDGTVVMNKSSRGLEMNISEQDLSSQKDIIKILEKFGITTNCLGIKIHLSTNFKSCLWYLKNGAFIGHAYNRLKLLSYFLNLRYIKLFYERYKQFNKMHITSFAKLHDLNYRTSEMFLFRNYKKGYLNINGKGFYSINQLGKSLIEIIEKARKEYDTLAFNGTKRSNTSYFITNS